MTGSHPPADRHDVLRIGERDVQRSVTSAAVRQRGGRLARRVHVTAPDRSERRMVAGVTNGNRHRTLKDQPSTARSRRVALAVAAQSTGPAGIQNASGTSTRRPVADRLAS